MRQYALARGRAENDVGGRTGWMPDPMRPSFSNVKCEVGPARLGWSILQLCTPCYSTIVSSPSFRLPHLSGATKLLIDVR